MGLEVLKTWAAEVLTQSDLNAAFNHLLTYIKQNKDRLLGDNAEGTDVTAHNHEGTYGAQITTSAISDIGTIATQDADSVAITGGTVTGITNLGASGGTITGITDLAIADGGTGAGTAAGARSNLGCGTIATQDADNVTISGGTVTGITDLAIADGGTGAGTAAGAVTNLGFTKTAAVISRAVLNQRIAHIELIWSGNSTISVSFPWTEPGGTAWSSVVNVDVSAEVGSGGNVKVGEGADAASTWYYLYMSNNFTMSQPVASEFIFTKSAAGESGYTLIGAIYNNSSQNVEKFTQHSRLIMWDDPIKVLNAGTASSYTDIDCSSACPGLPSATGSIIKLSGIVSGTVDAGGAAAATCYITKNGVTPADDSAQILAGAALYSTGSVSAIGNRDIQTDGSQVIEYKLTNTNVSNVAATIYVAGYYVR